MSVPQHPQHGLTPVEFNTPNRVAQNIPSSPGSIRASTSQTKDAENVPQEDRRSSSIATLRLKAREHEKELDKLRNNKTNDDSSN